MRYYFTEHEDCHVVYDSDEAYGLDEQEFIKRINEQDVENKELRAENKALKASLEAIRKRTRDKYKNANEVMSMGLICISFRMSEFSTV